MSAKHNILGKLRKSLTGTTPIADDFDVDLVTQPYTYSAEQRIPQLRKLMEAVHTEIHLTSGEEWPALLAQLLRDRQLPSLLIAPTTAHGQKIVQHWANNPELPTLKSYDRPMEEWKAELFNDTPASLTRNPRRDRRHRQFDHVANPRRTTTDEPGAAGAFRPAQGQ